MGYLVDERTAEDALKAKLDRILGLSLTPPQDWALAERSEWLEVKILIDRIFDYFKALKSSSFEGLTKNYVDSLAGVVDSVFEPLNNISKTIHGGNSPNLNTQLTNYRGQLMQAMNQHWVTQITNAILITNENTSAVTDILARVQDASRACHKEVEISKSQRTDINLWLEEAKKDSTDTLAKYDTEIKSRNEKLSEMETLYRNVLAKVGTHAHAVRFEAEAEVRGGESVCWLACVGVLLAFLFYYFWGMEGDVTALLKAGVKDVWPLLAIKGAIVSLASVILLACFRNFSACRHNHAVNRHRQNALSTYDFFLKSTEDDPEVKKAVALEVMKAVFTADHSGYLKAANETNLSANVFEGLKK